MQHQAAPVTPSPELVAIADEVRALYLEAIPEKMKAAGIDSRIAADCYEELRHIATKLEEPGHAELWDDLQFPSFDEEKADCTRKIVEDIKELYDRYQLVGGTSVKWQELLFFEFPNLM
jgi:hypothetical protein